ncbi:hypothetical protein NE865_08416 [Phthorimaea operculella]|nr:hypothetical protein NE865_08416 [Phthorimaea operculella]
MFFTDGYASVRKLGRRGVYALNLNFTSLRTVENNVSINIVFYEYLHNEFKRSFVEMKFKYCDFVTKDPLFSPMAKRSGLPCPIYPGFHAFYNISMASIPAVEHMKYKWPFKRAKLNFIFATIPEKVKMAEGDLIVSFKQ